MADQFNKIDIFGKNIDINDSVYDNDKDRFAQYTYDTKKDDFAQHTYDTKKDNFAQYTYDTKKDDFATNTYNTKKDNFAAYTLSNNVGGWQGRDVVNGIVWTDLRASFAWWTVWHTPTAEDPADWNGPYNIYVAIRQSAFDAAHPVGETYTQYPMQDPPATLYNKNGITSEWTPVTDYQGCFFRAEGGYAAAFTEKGNPLSVQGYQNAYHNHTTTSQSESITGEDSPDHSHNIKHGHEVDDEGHGHLAGGSFYGYKFGYYGEEGAYGPISGYTPYGNIDIGVTVYSGKANVKVKDCDTSSGGASTRHKHSYSHTHDTSYDGNVYAQESRPTNVTVRIWIRTR